MSSHSVSSLLLCLLCPDLCYSRSRHIVTTQINLWSTQLIFPNTWQENNWERHRPGSVYLCYYRHGSYKAFPFFSLFTDISILRRKRLRMGCSSVLPWRETEALEKNPHSYLKILFEALEIDEGYVIDFASWGLLFSPRWQLWVNKPVEAAVSLAFIRRVMITLNSSLCAQTFAIRHNDEYCHSCSDFTTFGLISLENAFLVCRLQEKVPMLCMYVKLFNASLEESSQLFFWL